jgi:hypothetical protein
MYWYPFVGRQRVEGALQTKWGQLFKEYGDGQVVMPGEDPDKIMAMAASGAAAAAGALFLGGTLLLKGAARRSNPPH